MMNLKLSKPHFVVTIATALLIFSSCIDNVKDDFDFDKAKEHFDETFPIKNVDPNHDWKTTQLNTIKVTSYGDAGEIYRITVFDANPLDPKASASMLTHGYVSNDLVLNTPFDCPIIQKSVYVMRTDSKNRNIVKHVEIDENMTNVTFGSSQMATRSNTESGDVVIETQDAPFSLDELNSVAGNAIELTDGVILEPSSVYKISAGTTFTSYVQSWNVKSNRTKILVYGKWDYPTKKNPGNSGYLALEDGVDICIMPGGELAVPSDSEMKFNNSSRLIIYPEGKISGDCIYLANGSRNMMNYNAGDIQLAQLHIDTKGYLYNCGTMNVDYLNFQNNAILTNQGKLEIDHSSEHCVVRNNCYFIADVYSGHLVLGKNCAAEFNKYNQRISGGDWNRTLVMSSNSMLTVKTDAMWSGATFTGPSSGYALIKTGKVLGANNFNHSGNIYYEVEEFGFDLNDIYNDGKYVAGIEFAKWGEAPLAIPAGECTGAGNIPKDEGEEIEYKPMRYTYAFEDNYPKMGDYDMNDLVLELSIDYERDEQTNKLLNAILDVKIIAIGATKQLGAGIRIIGKNNNSSSYNIDCTPHADFEMNDLFTDSSLFKDKESSTPHQISGIFGNAHHLLGHDTGTMLNTGLIKADEKNVVRFKITNASGKQEFPTLDDLDVFIGYKGTGKKRTEVHLYEFSQYGATPLGESYDNIAAAAGNKTWALCIPNFKYPKEYKSIKDAYPMFESWAQDRNTNQDWYLHPDENKIYK